MEAPTPTFCKDLMSKNLKKCNFSKACEKISIVKPKGKYSCSNLNSNKFIVRNQGEKSKKKRINFLIIKGLILKILN